MNLFIFLFFTLLHLSIAHTFPQNRIRVWESIPKFKVFVLVETFIDIHHIHNCFYFLETANTLRFKCFRNGQVIEMISQIITDTNDYIPTTTSIAI
jgi:hypothetical protein